MVETNRLQITEISNTYGIYIPGPSAFHFKNKVRKNIRVGMTEEEAVEDALLKTYPSDGYTYKKGPDNDCWVISGSRPKESLTIFKTS